MVFKKYPAIHKLEARHSVNLANAYKTKDSAKKSTHYIAESQRNSFISYLSNARLYSFLMDSSTDSGNIEDEMVVIMYYAKDEATETVKSCVRYFTIEVPESRADADGLTKCLGRALVRLGVENVLNKECVLGVENKPILVGGGTDGASDNIAEHNGMKGKLQQQLPWLYWAWCFAHRLELACKDALSSQLFKDLGEMLLRLYYLYSKPPKKCRELSDLTEDLKEVFEGGNLQVRSQGSRWINHKRKALQRVVDRYGAYVNHLLALEDPAVHSDDKAKLKGYVLKWRQPKMLIGAAMYIDVLKSPSLLSLTLQVDNLDIVSGIKNLLKSSKALRLMSEQDPQQWPTTVLVTSRIKEQDGDLVYQGTVLQGYSSTVLEQCSRSALADLKKLDKEIRTRLQWSDMEMLRSILVFLDTPSWVQNGDRDSDDLSEISAAVEYISSHLEHHLKQ